MVGCDEGRRDVSEQGNIEFEGVVYDTAGHWPLIGRKVVIPQFRIDGKIVGYNIERNHALIQQRLPGQYLVCSMRFLKEFGYE